MPFASSLCLYVHGYVNKKKKIRQGWSGHDLLSLLDKAVLPLQASIPSREGKTRVAKRGMSDIPLSWKSEASAPVRLLKKPSLPPHEGGWMNTESDISGLR